MKLKVIIRQAEEGGYRAEVPAIPGCATQGEDLRELIENVYDAVEGCIITSLSGQAAICASPFLSTEAGI